MVMMIINIKILKILKIRTQQKSCVQNNKDKDILLLFFYFLLRRFGKIQVEISSFAQNY